MYLLQLIQFCYYFVGHTDIMICCQRDQPGTSKSSHQIAKTLGMSDGSVRRIAKMDLELSAFRRMPAQVLSDAVKLKLLEQCKALLRRLTINKVKQVFFTDEKNFYLNPPVNTQNDHLWAKGKKKEVASS